jgi:hypothetical protein
MSPTTSRTQGASPHTNGNGTSRPTEPGTPGVMIDCKLDQVYYGGFLAVRDSHVVVERGKITGFIGPSGCGKSTGAAQPEPHERPHPGLSLSGDTSTSRARTSTRGTWTRWPCAATSAWSSSSRIPSR